MPGTVEFENDPITKTCLAAVRVGGQCLLEWKNKFSVTEKAPKDLVTEADLASQRAIFELISSQFPSHAFLGEEHSDANIDVNDLHKTPACWIVDPLDGTINYIHQLPSYSVSVAYAEYGVVKAGAVFDPVTDECYFARAGSGAWCNKHRIRASDQNVLGDALVIISLPTQMQRGGIHEQKALEMIHQARTIRRLGSAALNCCYVAAGKADAYWAESIHAWDIAAGMLIASEAAAIVTNIQGGDVELAKPKILASSTKALSLQIINLFGQLS